MEVNIKTLEFTTSKLSKIVFIRNYSKYFDKYIKLNFKSIIFVIIVLSCLNGLHAYCQEYIIDTLQNYIIDTSEFIVDTGNYTPLQRFGDDILIKNQWMPYDEVGALAGSGCYDPDDNKYYLYGGRRLIVINGDSNAILYPLTLTETGDVSEPYIVNWYCHPKMIAYNSGNGIIPNKVYCIYREWASEVSYGDKAKIKIFDASDDPEISTIVFLENLYYEYKSSFVKYDNNYEHAYWVINYNSSGMSKSKVEVINGLDNTIENISSLNKYIYDLEFNDDGSEIFLSTDDSIIVRDPNMAPIDCIYPIGNPRTLVYNSISSKLYAGLSGQNMIAVVDDIAGFPIHYITNIPYAGGTIQGCFNSEDNKVYFTQQNRFTNNGWILIIEGNYELEYLDFEGAESIIYNPYSDAIFCGGLFTVQCIDGNTNQIINAENIYRSSNFIFNSNNNQICSVSKQGNVEFLSSTGDFINRLFIGGRIFHSCYNNKENKIYLCQTMSKPSFVSIIDGNTSEIISNAEIDASINSCSYNYHSNKIFVGGLYTNQYYVINGSSQNVEAIDINGDVFRLFSGPHEKVYASVHADQYYIYVINADSYSYKSISLGNKCINSFCYDQYHNPERLFAGSYTNELIVIDADHNSIITQINLGYNNYRIAEIEFNPINNKIYCISISPSVSNCDSFLSIIDGETYEYEIFHYINNPWDNPVSIEYADKENKLFVISTFYLTAISGETNEILMNQDLYGTNILGMEYNEYNNRIYLQREYYVADNVLVPELNIISLSANDFSQFSFIPFEEKTVYCGIFLRDVPLDILFNCIDNKLYVSNFGFSNVSIIQCAPEIRTIHPRWNWLSFPRLDRDNQTNDPVDAIGFLENVDPFPSNLYIEHHEQPQNRDTYLTYDEIHQWQSHYLDYIYSDRGYKLNTDNPSESTLPCPGTVLRPDWEINLYGPDLDNWIGYFLTEPSWPLDAFEAVLDKLTMIQTQYWTMVKIFGRWFATEKVGPLQYGDMVNVKCTDTTCSFRWNVPYTSGPPKGYEKTSYFTYEEKADYTPIFVELDTTDLPLEVGVFYDTICYGAERVLPGDTMVQINAYIDTTGQGEDLEFEFYYGTKSAPVGKHDYLVLNQVTGRKEPRKITTGEHRDWYLVSFKKEDAGRQAIAGNTVIGMLSIQPNPFNDMTEIGYTLNRDSWLGIRILNMQGLEIRHLAGGNYSSGNYKLYWDGKDDSGQMTKKGLYVIIVETPEEVKTVKAIRL